MGCLPSRPLSSSAICAARKSPGATSTAQKGLPSIPLTGNLDVDGLHRFEIDLMETADWVKACTDQDEARPQESFGSAQAIRAILPS
ncbi:hypothetical protein BASA61_010028 [Batrachochytrium salamandrivorans]|nr:hypothetical protein BASA61_010028 [Batrachochytrium salamandrivorans]